MLKDDKCYCDYCGKEIIGRCKNHLERVKKHFCTREHRILSTMNKVEYKNDYVIIYVNYKGQEYECLVDIDDYENKIKPLKTKIFMYNTMYCYFSSYTKDNPRKKIKLHRFLTDCPKGKVVDHINRNRLDNRKCNLRCVDQIINFQNTICQRDSKSGVKGVYWNKRDKVWIVQVGHNGKKLTYGRYKNIEDAKKRVVEVRNILHTNNLIDKGIREE